MRERKPGVFLASVELACATVGLALAKLRERRCKHDYGENDSAERCVRCGSYRPPYRRYPPRL